MNATSARRVVATAVLIAAAVAGAVVRLLAAPGSTAYYLGTLFMVLWVPIVGNIIAFFIRRRRAKARAAEAPVAAKPFAAQLLVEVTLRHNRRSVHTTVYPAGEFACLLVIGSEGFSTRVLLRQDLLAGEARQVEAQFTAPEVALAKFPPGTTFQMLEGENVVGTGRAIGPIMDA